MTTEPSVDRRSIERTHGQGQMIFDMVWGMVDTEPELDGIDAGAVATAVEMAFRVAMCAVKGDPINPKDYQLLLHALQPNRLPLV